MKCVFGNFECTHQESYEKCEKSGVADCKVAVRLSINGEEACDGQIFGDYKGWTH